MSDVHQFAAGVIGQLLRQLDKAGPVWSIQHCGGRITKVLRHCMAINEV